MCKASSSLSSRHYSNPNVLRPQNETAWYSRAFEGIGKEREGKKRRAEPYVVEMVPVSWVWIMCCKSVYLNNAVQEPVLRLFGGMHLIPPTDKTAVVSGSAMRLHLAAKENCISWIKTCALVATGSQQDMRLYALCWVKCPSVVLWSSPKDFYGLGVNLEKGKKSISLSTYNSWDSQPTSCLVFIFSL